MGVECPLPAAIATRLVLWSGFLHMGCLPVSPASLLQGMLGRPDWEAMARTPFAQIPCGSGNALAASVGMWTVHTALHALIKGQRQAMDIASGGRHH
jgi:hypothetical protein